MLYYTKKKHHIMTSSLIIIVIQERLSYNDTVVHRIVSDFVIQMGDVTEGDGTGGELRLLFLVISSL